MTCLPRWPVTPAIATTGRVIDAIYVNTLKEEIIWNGRIVRGLGEYQICIYISHFAMTTIFRLGSEPSSGWPMIVYIEVLYSAI